MSRLQLGSCSWARGDAVGQGCMRHGAFCGRLWCCYLGCVELIQPVQNVRDDGRNRGHVPLCKLLGGQTEDRSAGGGLAGSRRLQWPEPVPWDVALLDGGVCVTPEGGRRRGEKTGRGRRRERTGEEESREGGGGRRETGSRIGERRMGTEAAEAGQTMCVTERERLRVVFTALDMTGGGCGMAPARRRRSEGST